MDLWVSSEQLPLGQVDALVSDEDPFTLLANLENSRKYEQFSVSLNLLKNFVLYSNKKEAEVI